MVKTQPWSTVGSSSEENLIISCLNRNCYTCEHSVIDPQKTGKNDIPSKKSQHKLCNACMCLPLWLCQYMANELPALPVCVVPCSDVWSLGCVLYELCTLRHPVYFPSVPSPCTLSLTVGLSPSIVHVSLYQVALTWTLVCFPNIPHASLLCPVPGIKLEEPDP